MCGIAGIATLDGSPVSAVILNRMTDAIAHRGPDGEGHYVSGAVGLGHRRLAIIDLSPAGQQPMLSPDGRFALVYNGEIYNFRELRCELERLGHRFHSRTDSEVVLHAYAAWGEDCVSRFNGMFAFAVWDRELGELFLARDRYGIKPLYYTFCGNSFLFGSEQKALTEFPGLRREVDLEALLEYFTFQNIFTERTLLKGVSIFPAGSWARLSTRRPSRALAPVRYWDYDFRKPDRPMGEQEYLEELDRLFCQAVNRQLVSDVDLGTYLSGGMDSGSITAIAASRLPYIKTFTCGFDLSSASGLELAFDERQTAEMMSALFKTEHYEMVLKAGDMERCLPQLAWHLEEPRVGQSYPNFYAAKLSSRFVKVVLSGAGGDELFGGYPWRYYRAAVNHSFDDYTDKYYRYWQRLIPESELARVFRPVWDRVSHVSLRDIFCGVFQREAQELRSPADYINSSLYFEAKTFLHGLLVVEDKISMAHGLETRVPFLDNDLVDFAQQIPISLKLRDLSSVLRMDENDPGKEHKYFQKTNDGKVILRKMMERYIPESVTRAEKQGFSAPDASWFKGESIDYVRRHLLKGSPLIYDYLDRDAVRSLVDDHLSGRQNRRLFIWSLLNVEQWLRHYLGGT
ncbi:asparagine synthase (glutamine-hydrolyzing) [Geomonas anaerohicana]|uniref:asparagine synthase (glutamine-hydrolyzing) n=1 Tax=Geomonas anaerohicana TaxID=2798583 RepID=A0ABS0YH64_9BACT|nr:asparagine synthase (glutamine-hydrolyzing) [Geomonas anaerohicana]MBJ6751677.1 asparagine synthase (glutamine-hydrolyzing) [Geomonas anaerohicana]